MRIIIAGAGDVGFHLAKLLAYEEQDIVIIDLDADRLAYTANHLDVGTIRGSATSFRVLEEAKILDSFTSPTTYPRSWTAWKVAARFRAIRSK